MKTKTKTKTKLFLSVKNTNRDEKQMSKQVQKLSSNDKNDICMEICGELVSGYSLIETLKSIVIDYPEITKRDLEEILFIVYGSKSQSKIVDKVL